MDVRQIERNLADLFSRRELGSRQLVFWYDPKAEFSEDVAELELPAGVEKVTLEDTPFTVKYCLLVEQPRTSFLLYAPFEMPAPQANWLLDLQTQGELFLANQAVLLFRFYGFHDRSLQGYLRDHLDFFKAKKWRDALAALGLAKDANELDLQVGLLSVLIRLKVPDAALLVRTVLMQGLNEEQNEFWQELRKFGLEGEFWRVVQHYLDAPEDVTTLRELFVRLALTHLQHDLVTPLPDSLKPKLIQPATRAYVFVSSWLRDSSDREGWKTLSRQLAPDLRIEGIAASMHPSTYAKAETFEAFDQALVDFAVASLSDGAVRPSWVRG